MKTLLATLALSLSLAAVSPAAELLLNGNFESAVAGTTLVNGNNIGAVPPNWIIGATATATTTTANLANLALGTSDGTQNPNKLPVTPDTTLASYLDGSTTHNQSFDGNAATVYVIQTFTLASASALNVTAVFGGRDYTSATAGNESNWTITTNAAPGTILYSGTPTLAPFGNWAADTGRTGVLPAGTYRINITLANPAEVDGVSVTNVVPEPSTIAAVAGGLCLLGVSLRRSRRS